MSKKQLTIVELRDKIGLLNTEKQGIFDKMKAEGRKADENEEKRLAEIVTDIADCELRSNWPRLGINNVRWLTPNILGEDCWLRLSAQRSLARLVTRWRG